MNKENEQKKMAEAAMQHFMGIRTLLYMNIAEEETVKFADNGNPKPGLLKQI